MSRAGTGGRAQLVQLPVVAPSLYTFQRTVPPVRAAVLACLIARGTAVGRSLRVPLRYLATARETPTVPAARSGQPPLLPGQPGALALQDQSQGHHGQPQHQVEPVVGLVDRDEIGVAVLVDDKAVDP